MTIEVLDQERLDFDISSVDIDLLKSNEQLLPETGRLCLELAVAQRDESPISGSPSEISDTLVAKTGLDRQDIIRAIKDAIHENSFGNVRAKTERGENNQSMMVVTPEGLTYLNALSDKLLEDA